jgi:adenylate cyclase
MENSMSMLGEFKQRSVFRIGMAYIVAAWVLVQVMDIILKNFGAADWVMKLLVFFCFAGFPLALWMAWTFEMTPEGVRKESHVDRTKEPHPDKGKKLDVFIMAMLAVVVGLVSLNKFMPQAPVMAVQPKAVAVEPEPDPIPAGPILENSIAVLPFVNMSAETNQDYFSDGLSEELLNVLTHVDGLNVASRTSSFAFKGDTRSIQQIARSLRVANILEGSVRKSGDRLRVTAQLIDADTDVHLWSDSFDRDMTDIFQVQDEIANAIVAALRAELGVGLEKVSVKSATSSLDAYDLYLQGREMFIARENLPTSWSMLERATVLDSGFAKAWETLAAVHSVATSWFPGDGIKHDSLALASARRALELQPNLSMPHAVIAMKHFVTGEGYTGAIHSLTQAVTNDPNNATALLWRGITFFDMGYAERSMEDFDACLAVDPGYLNCQQYRAMALLTQNRVADGIRAFEATLDDNFHSTTGFFVPYYVHSGQKSMAYAVASLAMRNQFAPIKYWIEAVEDPDGDHSARIARFNDWGEAHNRDICDMDFVAVSMKQDQCMNREVNAELKWMPDAAWFRKTQEFKDYANTYLMAFWQENGFPPQCRDLGEGDFECD